jgi:hypothetical protein
LSRSNVLTRRREAAKEKNVVDDVASSPIIGKQRQFVGAILYLPRYILAQAGSSFSFIRKNMSGNLTGQCRFLRRRSDSIVSCFCFVFSRLRAFAPSRETEI